MRLATFEQESTLVHQNLFAATSKICFRQLIDQACHVGGTDVRCARFSRNGDLCGASYRSLYLAKGST